ncbi:MAG TPA: DUF1269 domain-containing protein [Anaerolineales bacterium]|nr:DUF1269 domain-containing protein [Anaerolineales bacterium]
MSTLTVLKFSSPEGASQMLNKLGELQKAQLIQVLDAAIVTWPEGKKAPKTRQALNLPALKALDGAFWGMLFGLIFFVPFFGLAVGAAMGALSGKMADYGISDDFIKSTREKVTEGTSALFLLSSNAVEDKVLAELKGIQFELIASNLTKEEEDQLRAAFEAA